MTSEETHSVMMVEVLDENEDREAVSRNECHSMTDLIELEHVHDDRKGSDDAFVVDSRRCPS